MSYDRLIQIEFNHCDPAGIVFYPRYFEMTNSVVENFFADVVGRSFAAMHRGASNGVPTVRIEADFMAPAYLGDKILFSLVIAKLGRTSARVVIEGRTGDALRMRAALTLVWTSEMRAAPWPQALRVRMETFMEGAQ